MLFRSEEHTSELQSHDNLVCRLLLEKKKKKNKKEYIAITAHRNTCTRRTDTLCVSRSLYFVLYYCIGMVFFFFLFFCFFFLMTAPPPKSPFFPQRPFFR